MNTESYGPIYFGGQNLTMVPHFGANTTAHVPNGYSFNHTVAKYQPIQFLGFGIYCKRVPEGKELWLSIDPHVVYVDQQFLLDHGYPCTRLETREHLVETINFSRGLKKKYGAIRDKNSGLICVYDKDLIL